MFQTTRHLRITARTGAVEQVGQVRRRAVETAGYDVTLTMHTDDLIAALAKKAALSKKGLATAMRGAIKVTAAKR